MAVSGNLTILDQPTQSLSSPMHTAGVRLSSPCSQPGEVNRPGGRSEWTETFAALGYPNRSNVGRVRGVASRGI